jgi:hypothetical protein
MSIADVQQQYRAPLGVPCFVRFTKQLLIEKLKHVLFLELDLKLPQQCQILITPPE